MQILSVGNFGTSWDGSICDEEHIAKALESLGHKVVRLQRERLGQIAGMPWVSKLFDFCLLAQWDGYPDWFLKDLRGYGNEYPIVYWAFDYQADGQEWHERLVTASDLYLSKRIADSKYPNWQWLAQDFAPDFLLEDHQFGVEKDIDVLFTGSYLPWAAERTKVLKAIDEKFNLVVHSVTPAGWMSQGLKNVNGPILDQGLPALYRRAKINISVDHTIEAGYWSDRNAQIMACGGFVLSRYVPLAEATFGHHIAYFYTIDDCLEKIQYYLDDEFQREHMAQVGRGFAAENLTVTNRVEQLLTIVGSTL